MTLMNSDPSPITSFILLHFLPPFSPPQSFETLYHKVMPVALNLLFQQPYGVGETGLRTCLYHNNTVGIQVLDSSVSQSHSSCTLCWVFNMPEPAIWWKGWVCLDHAFLSVKSLPLFALGQLCFLSLLGLLMWYLKQYSLNVKGRNLIVTNFCVSPDGIYFCKEPVTLIE